MKCPCYQCDRRNDLCHIICQLYIDWNTEHLKQKEDARKASDQDIKEYEVARAWKKRKIHGFK